MPRDGYGRRLDFCRCGCDLMVPYPHRWAHGHAVKMYNILLGQWHRTHDEDTRKRMLAYGWKAPLLTEAPNFGIEAEFFGVDRYSAVQAIAAQDIPIMDDGYHHETRPYWRVTSDSSVSNEGNELVSPILSFASGDAGHELNTVMTVLTTLGARVDNTCGLHVHHDVRHMTPEAMAETVAHYAYFQDTIDRLLHPARIGSDFGMPMSDPMRWYDDIRTYKHIGKLWENASGFGRYHAINLSSIPQHGTLEFREHAGTLNPVVAMAWARFTRLFIDLPKRTTLDKTMELFGTPTRRGFVPEANVTEMCTYLGADAALTEYLDGRADHYDAIRGGYKMATGEDRDLESRARGEYDDPEDDEAYCDECGEYGHVYDDHEFEGG